MLMTQDNRTLIQAAIDQLQSYLSLLKEAGYARYKVDELRHPGSLMRVRYGYSAHEWRIQTITPAGEKWTIKYDHAHPLPTLEQLVEETLNGPSETWLKNHDATGETMIRGLVAEAGRV